MNKSTARNPKLKLVRETLRVLDAERLQLVHGGAIAVTGGREPSQCTKTAPIKGGGRGSAVGTP